MIILTLKACRVNSNYKRVEIGTMLGKTEKTIYNWEVGLQIPDRGNLAKLSEIYGVHSDQIFLGDKSALSEFYKRNKSSF